MTHSADIHILLCLRLCSSSTSSEASHVYCIRIYVHNGQSRDKPDPRANCASEPISLSSVVVASWVQIMWLYIYVSGSSLRVTSSLLPIRQLRSTAPICLGRFSSCIFSRLIPIRFVGRLPSLVAVFRLRIFRPLDERTGGAKTHAFLYT
jgi:hypothetical protein